MSRTKIALLTASLLMLALSASISYADTDHPMSESPIVCGNDWMNRGDEEQVLENTRKNNPAVYYRILQSSFAKKGPRVSSAGELEIEFKVLNRVSNQYDFVMARLHAEGKFFRIWVDTNDIHITSRYNKIKSFIPTLAKALDTSTTATSRNPAKGIIENDIEVYGQLPTPPNPNDEKTEFLMVDIKDGISTGGYVAGFFSPNDQTTNLSSNGFNMLYIDDNEGIQGSVNAVLSTLAHEFQHLIHYNTNRQSEKFPNEGCSEAASIICGYRDRSNSDYMNGTNVALFRWSETSGGSATEVLKDYTRAMCFHHYIKEQFGETVLTKLASIKSTGTQRYQDALTAVGTPVTFNDMFNGFGVANYVQANAAPDPRYRYTVSLGIAAKSVATYTGTNYPLTNDVLLEDHAIRYYIFNTPGGIKLKFTTVAHASVMAILYRPTTTTVEEVRELKTDGTEYQLGDSRAYNKIVLVVVNHDDGSSTVSWTASAVTLGVNQGATESSSLRFTSVPNPISSSSNIQYVVPSSNPVMLAVFDELGTRVATLVNGKPASTGTQNVRFDVATLPSGHYILQLTQDGKQASQSIIVVK